MLQRVQKMRRRMSEGKDGDFAWFRAGTEGSRVKEESKETIIDQGRQVLC